MTQLPEVDTLINKRQPQVQNGHFGMRPIRKTRDVCLFSVVGGPVSYFDRALGDNGGK